MIPLYKPYMSSSLHELDAILHSGSLTFGKYGKEFEKKIELYIGAEKVTLVNSFNSAVLVSLISLGIKPDDEVIASPMACMASNQPIVTIGARVVWADIDPKTGTLDPEGVTRKITSKTKAIFHNHFCGYPGYIDEINAIGREYGIPVVDDAIEAFGSEYKNKKMGNSGTDVTIFSFQAVRLPTTIDGGAIQFKNSEMYERSLLVRDSGIDRKYFRDKFGEINSNYDITVPGFGATMSEVNSYIGLQQMQDIDLLIAKQRNNASTWNERICEAFDECQIFNGRKEVNPNFWVFGILTKNKANAIKKFRDNGFYASGVHAPNNYNSIFRNKEFLMGVDKFYSEFVAVPSGWWFDLSKQSTNYV